MSLIHVRPPRGNTERGYARFLRSETKQGQERVNMKHVCVLTCGIAAISLGYADTVIFSDSPTVVRRAEIREAIRQDLTWTSENIQKNPYLFLQEQISSCDNLMAKIDAQKITLVRMGKKATRTAEDAVATAARYSKFLSEAKEAFKKADAEKKWPIFLNGYELDEEELSDKIADALERIELAQKEKKDNDAIAKKVEIRQGILKAKRRELSKLRSALVQQAEQVKMNAALAQIGDLSNVLGTIKDMMIEIDEDPTKLSVDDLTAEDPNAKRNKAVRAFLND